MRLTHRIHALERAIAPAQVAEARARQRKLTALLWQHAPEFLMTTGEEYSYEMSKDRNSPRALELGIQVTEFLNRFQKEHGV